jgi:hypoxanthine phosphoribosyltransferase
MDNMFQDFLDSRKDIKPADRNNYKLVLSENEIQEQVKKCADVINRRFENKNLLLVCLLKGSVWFYSDLTKNIVIPYSTYFIEASSYKNNKFQDDTIEILSKIIPSKFENKHVILIDELYDSGKTMESMKVKITELTNVKLENIYSCCLLVKNSKNISKLDIYGCVVPDVWLIGYGLDDCQEKRGWRHIVEYLPPTV